MTNSHASIGRRRAALSLKSSRDIQPSASLLAQKIAATDYAQLSESELMAQARTVLSAARLTTFVLRTKADAVSVIEGIRPAGRAYAR